MEDVLNPSSVLLHGEKIHYVRAPDKPYKMKNKPPHTQKKKKRKKRKDKMMYLLDHVIRFVLANQTTKPRKVS